MARTTVNSALPGHAATAMRVATRKIGKSAARGKKKKLSFLKLL